MAPSGTFISTLVIVGLGAAASLLLWHTLDSRQAIEVERDASRVAGSLAQVIVTRIEEQDLGALRRWASSVLTTTDSEAWRNTANIFLADHPSFPAIARVENGQVAEVAAAGNGRESLSEFLGSAPELLRASDATELPREIAAGPRRLADGSAALGIRVETTSDSGSEHLIVALFVPAVAVRGALDQRGRRFAVRVLFGGEEVFRNANADRVPAGNDEVWAVERTRTSVGRELAVMAHTTESLAEASGDNTPLVALIAGLLISALIASLVHVSQTSRGRAAALASMNIDLRERMRETTDDKTEIRRLNTILEARVEERTAALQETIGELETFNYSVSHDLRSPLGAILNFAAILSQDYGDSLDASGREYLRRISSSANGMVSLMDGLLAFSRSGREELTRSRVDVQRLVEGLRDDQLSMRGAGSCKFSIGELPPVYADPAMLRLMFGNLIANACKFVRSGESPTVEIGGKIEGNNVVYFVRDQGIGFDMRYAEKLFGVFERLHASDDYDGHGVGLAIVARLARRHGGRTWAEGALGKGATFYIQLPLQDGRDGDRSSIDV